MLGQRLLKLFLFVAAGISTSSLGAEEENALYGAALPVDAVFVRHIGAAGFPVHVLGRSFAPGDFDATAYTAVAAEVLEGAVAGSFYTILTDGGESHLIQEPGRNDRSRVHLFLLNASGADARLVVAHGGPEVIANVPKGEIETRSVNPLAVELSVETVAGATDFDVVLRRGVNVTFLVEDGAVRLIEHRFGPVIGQD